MQKKNNRLPALINKQDTMKKTPLLNALWSGQDDIVRILVKHGADTTIPINEAGETVIDLVTNLENESNREHLLALLEPSRPATPTDTGLGLDTN